MNVVTTICRSIAFVFVCTWSSPVHTHDYCNHDATRYASSGLYAHFGQFFKTVIYDAFRVNFNLIDWDTYKALIATFPFYAIARMSDGRLQSCFYNRAHHRNVHQLDSACKGLAQYGIVYPIFFAGVLSVAAHDYELLKTSRIYLIGFPFVMLAANVIKKFDTGSPACLRPWNQFFSSKKRSCGGFPSGHMAVAMYTAMLYGLRFGVKYAVPLGGYALFVALCFLNCNRHYASQLVAGAGLGAAYALAADKVIDIKLSAHPDRLRITTEVDRHGAPAVRVAWLF